MKPSGSFSRLGATHTALIGFVLVSAFVAWRIISIPRVSVSLPQRGDAAEVVYATGTVKPKNWAKVVSITRKRIVEVCNCEGERVRKGDILARLDSVEERALLAELEARRDTLKADAERLDTLVKRGAATQVALDEKLTQLREYEAKVSAYRDRVYDLDLRAPTDGVVLRSDATVGEVAGVGNDDVLFWVGEPRPLVIEADVNEEDIARVQPGQTVLLRHDGFAGVSLVATVAHITPKGDPETKTFEVTLALPDDTPLQIGMSVEANVVVKEAKGVLLIPVEAVEAGRVRTVVAGQIKTLPVKTGIRGGSLLEIVSGIDPATPVIIPFDRGLVEGEQVSVSTAAK